MGAHLNKTRVEWGFVVLLAGFCLVLSVMQYRWTGELSRAEAEHLRTELKEQAQLFCRAFDSVLTDNCQTLLPADEPMNDGNREAIHADLFQKWKSGNPPPLFSRVAIAVSTPDGAQLLEQNLTTGQLVPLPWPPAWDAFHQFLSPESRIGPQAFEKPGGMLIMLPVSDGQPWKPRPPNSPSSGTEFRNDGGPPHGPGPGPARLDEWMLFELDSNYLCKVWLPKLIRRHLNPDGQTLNDVEVKTTPSPGAVIFSTAGGAVKPSASRVKAPFNRQGHYPEDHGPGSAFCWELEVNPHPGALEAVVAAAHQRNLAVAFMLNALIFAAALALLHHTRRSRKLAETQMKFVATVSHELRTPLTVIRGAGHNLLRGVAREPGQIEQYSQLIIQHAEQLTDLVEQILELAGANRNSAAALRKPIVVPDLLRAAVTTATQDAQTARCEVQLELPPDLPGILGDAPALRRLFQNLITNAAKHGGAGGWIGITAVNESQGKPPMVAIRIADRGPGIPAAELPDIFKPFFRGAAAQKMHIRGSGLGLSVVKEIVEGHGGTVLAESRPGRGAIFVVRLPAANL